MKSRPICVVLGTTGVGKSALAIQLANKLKGQIINGDSMQVYKGLDIITNKPDETERRACRHHLFDFLETSEEYSVLKYEKDALDAISTIHNQCELPIIVGGTNYYIQSLLWRKSVISSAPSLNLKIMESCHSTINTLMAARLCHILESSDPKTKDAEEIKMFNRESTAYDALVEIDPIMAKRWHPKDSRKIRRSLEIYYTTGITQSKWYQDQKEDESLKLRFPTIFIWLYSEPDILDTRLDLRVDEMLKRGMVQEMTEMISKMDQHDVIGVDSQYTRGILQAIGFKEFHNYFACLKNNDEKEKIEKAFRKGLDDMKLATRQYARQQVHWIKNKLAPECNDEHERGAGAFYVVDATDPVKTAELIDDIVDLVESFIDLKPNKESLLMAPGMEYLLKPLEKEDNWDQFVCHCCVDLDGRKRIFNGELIWNEHKRGRPHMKKLDYLTNPRPKDGDIEGWKRYQQIKK